jgi:LytR cell envelope-related transcriptional attenuator
MNRQQHGGGAGDVARGAGYAALLGALLIGVAVVIGIVLLQIGDRNDNGPATAGTTHRTTTTKKHTSSSTSSSSTPTTGATQPPKAPSALRVIVLNGGAPSGTASSVSAALKPKGYTNQPDANTWRGHTQTGTTVYCRSGLGREGAALAAAVGSGAALHIPFPTPAPPFTAGVECAVVVGA